MNFNQVIRIVNDVIFVKKFSYYESCMLFLKLNLVFIDVGGKKNDDVIEIKNYGIPVGWYFL